MVALARVMQCGAPKGRSSDIADQARDERSDVALGVTARADVQRLTLANEPFGIKGPALARQQRFLGPIRGEHASRSRPDATLFSGIGLGDSNEEVHREQSALAGERRDRVTDLPSVDALHHIAHRQ